MTPEKTAGPWALTDGWWMRHGPDGPLVVVVPDHPPWWGPHQIGSWTQAIRDVAHGQELADAWLREQGWTLGGA